MSAYIQRLLDRGAALPPAVAAVKGAAAAPSVMPATRSTSPAVGYDQRLADSSRSGDFSLLGISPDSGDDAAAQDGASAGADDAAALAPVAALSPNTLHSRSAAVPPRVSAVPATQPIASERSQLASPQRPAAAEPTPTPLTVVRPAVPAPAASAPDTAQLTVGLHNQPRHAAAVQPAAAWLPAPAPPAALRRSVDTVDTPAPLAAAALATASTRPAVTTGRAAVAPAITQPPLARATQPLQPHQRMAQSNDPLSRTPVQPPLRRPQPLPEPAVAATEPHAIQALVREAVRREMARLPGAASASAGSAPPPPATAPAAAEGQAARRPATAREASLIGELQASSSPLTLFGLRRR